MENQLLEYKEFLDLDDITKYLREIVGFLNSKGGALIIGMNDSGSEIGIENLTDKKRCKFENKLKNGISPSITNIIEINYKDFNFNGDTRTILEIRVGEGLNKPYYIKKYGLSEKGVYKRLGTSTMPLTLDEILQYDKEKLPYTHLEDIRSPLYELSFNELLELYQEKHGSISIEVLINNLNLLSYKGGFNYLAYLLSDNNLLDIQISYFEGDDKSKLISTKNIKGNSLLKKTLNILNFVNSFEYNLSSFYKGVRYDEDVVDITVLREGIINAIAHNDYLTKNYPSVYVFNNRIEIINHGKLLISLEDMFKGVSKVRNEGIVHVLRTFKLMERIGMGVFLITNKYGRDVYEYSEEGEYLKLTIPLLTKETMKVVKEGTLTKYESKKPRISSTALLDILKDGKERKSLDLSYTFGISKRSVNLYLKDLVEQGLVEKLGSSRSIRYKITPHGKEEVT